MSSRILVLGGTGMLGRPVVQCLTDKGYTVRILTRNVEKTHNIFGATIEIAEGTAMNRAETEAVAMGVHQAYLESTDFQAVGFYEKRGYQVFAQLEDQPPGHICYYMKNTNLNERPRDNHLKEA